MAATMISAPAKDAKAVVPDQDESTYHNTGIYVGVTGDLAVEMKTGATVTFVGVAAGGILPIRIRRVLSANTTADGLILVRN